MEIPLNAQVECKDDFCGKSVCVLINPVVDEVTHLVVQENSSQTEYLVPVDVVSKTIAGTIQLSCSKAELETMDPFIKTNVIEEKISERYYSHDRGMIGEGAFYYLPFVEPDVKIEVPVEERQIPLGEMVVKRGTQVEATDGYVGKVDEFVVNPKNCHITHLVMREGHLWGKKDVIIPVSAMGAANEETVHLKINKRQIEELPSFPLRRRWI